MRKTILLTALFISTTAFGVYVAPDAPTTYASKRLCETTSGVACYEKPSGQFVSDLSLVPLMINDETKPIYEAPSNEVLCEAVADDPLTTDVDETKTQEEDCIAKEAIQSCGMDQFVVRVAENTKVYCTKLTGYEQKDSGQKHLVLDQAKKDARLALEAQAKVEADELNSRLKNMDFGKVLIAKIAIRNDKKTLTTAQIATLSNTYAPIQSLLQSGSIKTAKDQVTALAPDAVFTQEDKDFILGEMNTYLGL